MGIEFEIRCQVCNKLIGTTSTYPTYVDDYKKGWFCDQHSEEDLQEETPND